MSQPGNAVSARKKELSDQAGWALVDAVPEGWRRIDLRLLVSAGVHDALLTVTMADGSHPAIDPPQEAIDALLERRPLGHVPGEGTWFSHRLVIEPPGKVSSIFNFDNDPLWSPSIPAEAWQRDLAEFPRDEAHLPGWLRDRLAGTEPSYAPVGEVGGMGPVEQNETLGLITNLVAEHAPADWTHVVGTYRAVGDHVECPPLMVWDLTGSVDPWEPPAELAFLFDRLRAGMYYRRVEGDPETGRGTWSAVDFTVEFDRTCRIHVSYDWDVEPPWSKEPATESVRRELVRFPRQDTDVPEWMRRRAGLSAPRAGGPRLAPVFAATDEDRSPVEQAERDSLLGYLDRAPIVLAARGYDTDRLDPTAPRTVPMTFHTDGTWVWSGAVGYYLRVHDVAPDPELVAHIRAREFRLPEVDESARDRAVSLITGAPPAGQA